MTSTTNAASPVADSLSADLRLGVRGMTCASCVGGVETALCAVPGVSAARVNLAAERSTVHAQASIPAGDVVAAVKRAGYDVSMGEIAINIGDMNCATCVGRVEKAIARVPGVISVTVILATEGARVVAMDRELLLPAILAAVQAAGYTATSDTRAAAGSAASGMADHGWLKWAANAVVETARIE
ncbi:MAG: copper ion binding protein [Casimicrobiaceae bacterium]